MRLLTSPAALARTFEQQLNKHAEVSFAVAWASHPFVASNLLIRSNTKIKRGIVGTHFCQTDDAFIEKFLGNKHVRFVRAPRGIFHPKVYFFETNNEVWSCIIGSGNFTRGGFLKNSEACLLIESDDTNSESIRRGLEKTLNSYWNYPQTIKDREALERYRLAKKGNLGSKSDIFEVDSLSDDPPPFALDKDVIRWSWGEYARRVEEDEAHDIAQRLDVLKASRLLFQTKGSFQSLSVDERRGVAGFNFKSPVHWGWFGSMFGAGEFKKLVNANDEGLSEALDAIPMQGAIVRTNYINFKNRYVASFPKEKGHGLGTATRLLAMKRPDYFVCWDSANKPGLNEAFDVKLRHHQYERYWDRLIEPMLVSKWWNAPRPASGQRRAIWDGRAALLDSIFYIPK